MSDLKISDAAREAAEAEINSLSCAPSICRPMGYYVQTLLNTAVAEAKKPSFDLKALVNLEPPLEFEARFTTQGEIDAYAAGFKEAHEAILALIKPT